MTERIDELEEQWLRAARTRLLELPTRARDRLSHLTSTDVRALEEVVREVLQEWPWTDDALQPRAPKPRPGETP